MSDYSKSTGDRDAFFAALGRVFEEHRPVSDGYGVTDLSRLDHVLGRAPDQRVGVTRDENGRVRTSLTDPELFEFFPGGGSIDDCVTVIPRYPEGVLTWDCIMYRGPDPGGF